MIKAKKGKVPIKGTTREILGDFGAVVNGVFDVLPETAAFDAEHKKAVMREVFEFALLSEEEQREALGKQAKAALSTLSELLGAIVKDDDDETSEETPEEKEDAE